MHTANQRSDVLHKRSTELVQTCDGIALEDLTIRKMVRNRHLSTSILDSGWGRFKQSLTDKAASAGREIRLSPCLHVQVLLELRYSVSKHDLSTVGWSVRVVWFGQRPQRAVNI
jgi:IS605 OrfB family transposase